MKIFYQKKYCPPPPFRFNQRKNERNAFELLTLHIRYKKMYRYTINNGGKKYIIFGWDSISFGNCLHFI